MASDRIWFFSYITTNNKNKKLARDIVCMFLDKIYNNIYHYVAANEVLSNRN